MKKYVITFGISYTILTLALAALGIVIDKGGSSLNIVATIAASFIAASRFAKDQKREPTPKEKSTYAWGSLGASFLVSFILVALVIQFLFSTAETIELTKAFSSGMILGFGAVGLVIIGALYYVVIKWSFSWYASKAVR